MKEENIQVTQATYPDTDPLTPDEMKAFLDGLNVKLGLSMPYQEPDVTEEEILGAGGTGDVFSAKDKNLGRDIAIKFLRGRLKHETENVERMIQEAQAAAKLEHPNIIPIYSIGFSPTRGPYFTMKRMRGDSMRKVLTELAYGNPAYTWVYTYARRLSMFIRLCQGIAFAHSKGLLHRDLKPENIRIGNYGEVTIIDWGLVRNVPNTRDSTRFAAPSPIVKEALPKIPNIRLNQHDLTVTQDGEVLGTLRYMSPEQAEGKNSELDVRSDIFTLGVILYELLTFTNPFFRCETSLEIHDAICNGDILSIRSFSSAKDIPVELEAICKKAMASNRDLRYQTVGELLADLYAHQEGKPVLAYPGNVFTRLKKLFHRNPLKTAVFFGALASLLTLGGIIGFLEHNNYQSILEQVEDNLRTASRQQSVIQRKLDANRSIQSTKAISDYLTEIDNHFDTANLLISSLTHFSRWRPKVSYLHERIFIQRMRFDIRNQRYLELARQLSLCEKSFRHGMDECSQELRDTVQQVREAIRGECLLRTINTLPAEATITIYPLKENPSTGLLEPDSPLVLYEDNMETAEGANAPRTSATTPLSNIRLAKGSYLIQVKQNNIPVLLYPICLKHGETRSVEIQIPAAIPEDTAYIPAGTALLGAEPTESQALPAYFIGLHEVSFLQYRDFWKTLEDPETRKRWIPMIQHAHGEKTIPAWNQKGLFTPNIYSDRPVVGIPQEAAEAYCEWYGEKHFRPCRLPTAEEWEKAARGVDGRLYPWGNFFMPDYAYTIENDEARELYGNWAQPGAFPLDSSPYGVMDMAGNVREWTSSNFADSTGLWQIKGASASTSRRYLPLSLASDSQQCPSDVGFRILFPFQPQDIAMPDDLPMESAE